MKALGMIETIGLVGAIEAADTALKTADVEIVNKHIVKGGIVTVELSGDVGAIKVAVEAGAEAAKRLGVFVSSHVIARPDEMVSRMIEADGIVKYGEEVEEKTPEVKTVPTETKEENIEETIEKIEEPVVENVEETIDPIVEKKNEVEEK